VCGGLETITASAGEIEKSVTESLATPKCPERTVRPERDFGFKRTKLYAKLGLELFLKALPSEAGRKCHLLTKYWANNEIESNLYLGFTPDQRLLTLSGNW